jgi:cell wall-associated NlpC family hydrolase
MVEKISRKLLNVPFVAGGKSPLGIDNGGFIQLVFKCIGILLPRDIASQSKEGNTIDFINAVKIGDIVFFSQSSELITHAGIAISDNQIIHVSGYVRIDKIDHYGIFNSEIEQYTHRLKIIKRLY